MRRPKLSGARAESLSRGACDTQTTLAPERNRSRGCLRRPKHSGARSGSLSRGACEAQNTLAPERNRSRGVLVAPQTLWRPSRIAFEGCLRRPKTRWRPSEIALEGCLRRPNHSGARAEWLSRSACDAQTTLAAERNRSRGAVATPKPLWQPSRIALG